MAGQEAGVLGSKIKQKVHEILFIPKDDEASLSVILEVYSRRVQHGVNEPLAWFNVKVCPDGLLVEDTPLRKTLAGVSLIIMMSAMAPLLFFRSIIFVEIEMEPLTQYAVLPSSS
ncbi:hypothetical protein [Thermococcus pacificus]|uniref:Uncharacterized protein n=1 Tax=Thermococcus pacificus TaxID=71998 RepID=A0A218P5N9_9EURY|nr:hypothetical protein [Thermococcus pacificus]ASJ06116.1 hypothetical protein A3L08_01620 [Thermococcus pacificus]